MSVVRHVPYYVHPFRVYISYPNEDIVFASAIRNMLELMGVDVYLAQHDKQFGKELWDKFSKEIDDSDCVLVLYTASAVDSEWVKKEIYIAKTMARRLVPVREDGVPLPQELRGECKEYGKLDRDDLVNTLLNMGNGIWNLRNETPHVFFLGSGSRRKIRGNRLILIPKEGKAFTMGNITDDLVRNGRIRSSSFPNIGRSFQRRFWEDVWAVMLGFEYVKGEPVLADLSLG